MVPLNRLLGLTRLTHNSFIFLALSLSLSLLPLWYMVCGCGCIFFIYGVSSTFFYQRLPLHIIMKIVKESYYIIYFYSNTLTFCSPMLGSHVTPYTFYVMQCISHHAYARGTHCLFPPLLTPLKSPL